MRWLMVWVPVFALFINDTNAAAAPERLLRYTPSSVEVGLPLENFDNLSSVGFLFLETLPTTELSLAAASTRRAGVSLSANWQILDATRQEGIYFRADFLQCVEQPTSSLLVDASQPRTKRQLLFFNAGHLYNLSKTEQLRVGVIINYETNYRVGGPYEMYSHLQIDLSFFSSYGMS